MSDQKKVYADAAGFIQKFGNDKDAVTTRDVNGGSVRDFTIKAIGSQKLIRVSVFDEFDCEIPEDAFIAVEGVFTKREVSGTVYNNITANKLAVDGVTYRKAARNVVNAQDNAGSTGSSSSDDDGPGF